MLAAQAKPLIKVVVGYGSTDGGIAALWFAKETKLFEKHGLDVVLVGMGTGSVSLRALIAKDLQISSLSGSGLVQAALQGADTVLIAALINGFVFKVFGAPEITSPAQLKGKKLGVSRYGATSDFAVRLALKKWGLNPERDVSILQIGTISGHGPRHADQNARRRRAERHGVADRAQSGLSRAGRPRRPGAALPDVGHRHDEILSAEKRRARERIHARLHRSDP